MSIEIANESGVEVDEQALASLARHVLTEMGVNPLAELSVLLVDVGYMADLHQRWMGEAGPTDVLAFPMDELDTARSDGPGGEDDDDEPALLGDVVLCPEVAARQAAEAGHGTADELHLLCAHGVLHLLGYDHGDADQEKEMFGVQGRVLAAWQATREAAPARSSGPEPAP